MILSLLLALTSPAAALDLKWWGVGPNVGTMLFPTEYPVSFPAGAKQGGKITGDPLVDKVGFDIEVGAHGVLYPTAKGRIGAHLAFGFGSSSFSRQEFTLEYEPTLMREGSFQLLAGGGLGFGHERFNNPDSGAYLSTSYYPIRAQISGLLRDKSRAYELSLYGTWHIAGKQDYYRNADAQPIDGKGNEKLASGALYVGLGLEATVYFGDFFTDRKKKNRNGKKNRRN